MLIGLYSPRPQSGKSTITAMLAATTDVSVLKISGIMKAMAAASFSALVDDVDAYVDGKEKDTPIDGLTPLYVSQRLDGMLNALMLAVGAEGIDTSVGLVTPERLLTDLQTTFIDALEALDKPALSSRDIQKVLGLEWGRALYGADFWIRLVTLELAGLTSPVVVVDDVRFPADFDFIKDNGGITVKIERPSAAAPDAHGSEGLLENHPFDVTLVNDHDLATLKTKVQTTLISRL